MESTRDEQSQAVIESNLKKSKDHLTKRAEQRSTSLFLPSVKQSQREKPSGAKHAENLYHQKRSNEFSVEGRVPPLLNSNSEVSDERSALFKPKASSTMKSTKPAFRMESGQFRVFDHGRRSVLQQQLEEPTDMDTTDPESFIR